MITKEFTEAAAEIDEILGYLPKEYVEKVPFKMRELFRKTKDNKYVSKINPYKSLDSQELLPKTRTLIAIIYRNYWCNEEERSEIDKILIENERKYEEELREKYNPDNIFKKNNNDEIKEVDGTSLVIYDNKTWIQKAAEYISNIFKKIFNK